MSHRARILVMIMLAVTIFPLKSYGQFFVFENEMVGKEAAEFTLGLVSGQESSLSKVRSGKKAMVFFWATWCPHCRAALKELNSNYASFQAKNISVILVDVGEPVKTVEGYLQKNNIQMDSFLDLESKVSEDYGIIGLPTFFFVNEKGKVTAVEHQIPANYEEILSKE